MPKYENITCGPFYHNTRAMKNEPEKQQKPMVDEKRMRQLAWVNALSFLQCFDTAS